MINVFLQIWLTEWRGGLRRWNFSSCKTLLCFKWSDWTHARQQFDLNLIMWDKLFNVLDCIKSASVYQNKSIGWDWPYFEPHFLFPCNHDELQTPYLQDLNFSWAILKFFFFSKYRHQNFSGKAAFDMFPLDEEGGSITRKPNKSLRLVFKNAFDGSEVHDHAGTWTRLTT